MATKPHTTQEYINQLASSLKKYSISDIDDILADYQDYFAQSKAKGYSDTETLRRLPSAQELAASYNDKSSDIQASTPNEQPSSTQKFTLFGATLLGDILLLPALLIMLLLLACFSLVGFFLLITGPLLFIPDSILGQIDIARPSSLQILPTALLFVASGVAIVGVCAAISERIYSAYRASIVVRRWLLTGKHNNHIKLVPGVGKQFRTLLYKITLIAGAAAVGLGLILVGISWFTEGTTNFPSTWNM